MTLAVLYKLNLLDDFMCNYAPFQWKRCVVSGSPLNCQSTEIEVRGGGPIHIRRQFGKEGNEPIRGSNRLCFKYIAWMTECSH